MRKHRRAWLLAVHRWLFYLALVVVLGSALSRIAGEDEDVTRADVRPRSSLRDPSLGRGAVDRDDDDRDDDDRDDDGPSFMAFAGCR
jgi:hypothetical protein